MVFLQLKVWYNKIVDKYKKEMSNIIQKKYQVFISSTYNDLIDERREVIQALLELDCIPTGMELFQASDMDQWNWIKQVINDCDYFIVIIAGRYGTIHEDYGISYTEMEYRYALEIKKPIIGFLYKNIDALPVSKSETDPEIKKKLSEFRSFVSRKLIKYWSNEYELSGAVTRSVIQIIKTVPMPGWIKADNLPDIKKQNSSDMEKQNSSDIKCNFCHESSKNVTWMIAGPGDVYICDKCVDICCEIIKEKREEDLNKE